MLYPLTFPGKKLPGLEVPGRIRWPFGATCRQGLTSKAVQKQRPQAFRWDGPSMPLTPQTLLQSHLSPFLQALL